MLFEKSFVSAVVVGLVSGILGDWICDTGWFEQSIGFAWWECSLLGVAMSLGVQKGHLQAIRLAL